LGRRSRKRRGDSGTPAAEPAPAAQKNAPARPPGYARSEARNEEIRAQLRPLAAGERPRALVIATWVAALMAVANLLAAFLVDFGGEGAGTKAFAAIQSLVLLAAAWGMWRARYWAVLGFQAILGLQILVLSLALLRVEGVLVGLAVVVIIGGLGAMFWSLVRIMARLQLPQRPAR